MAAKITAAAKRRQKISYRWRSGGIAIARRWRQQRRKNRRENIENGENESVK
jgi:hypothetical protein